jgi:hypothetical protein
MKKVFLLICLITAAFCVSAQTVNLAKNSYTHQTSYLCTNEVVSIFDEKDGKVTLTEKYNNKVKFYVHEFTDQEGVNFITLSRVQHPFGGGVFYTEYLYNKLDSGGILLTGFRKTTLLTVQKL